MLYYYAKDKGRKIIDPLNNVYDHKIKMLICITMYNEDIALLERSL